MKLGTLRNKILFSMVFLLLIAGFFIWVTARMFLETRFRSVFKEGGIKHAQVIAANSLPDVLTLNRSHLQKMVENIKSAETDIAYVFIVRSSGDILAHTFPNGFPVALIEANSVSAHDDFKIQALDTNTMGFIYDIAVPIRLDKSALGQVRIGIAETGMHQALTSLHLIMLATTLVFVVLGAFLAFQLSNLITRPLSQLVGGIEAVKKGDFSAKINVRSNDEIGLLAEAFNKMSDRLRSLLDETDALAKSRERERIALDFHDSCAQDLVSLLKRIELCEKLVEAQSEEIPEELRLLKENTKHILTQARKMIYDLKSKEDDAIPFLERIRHYLENYERINGFSLELKVSGSLNALSPAKQEDLFYVITEALSNARKHSNAKKVTLDIKADPPQLRVSIRDDGRGFDAEAEKISDPRRGKFGLLVMRQRAEALGARLNIQSTIAQGSEIVLTLPIGQKI